MQTRPRPAIAAGVCAVVVLGGAGCGPAQQSSPSTGTTASAAVPIVTPSPSATSPSTESRRAWCEGAELEGTLTGWGPATVGEFREFGWGGPQRRMPLKDAFPASPLQTQGAWCVISHKENEATWYAVVPGQPPAMAVTVAGPGEHKVRGEGAGAPVVP